MRALYDVAELPADTPIFVYGAGAGGRLIVEAMRARGDLRIEGVADRSGTGEIFGFPVLGPDALAARWTDDAVLVIASQWWRAIADDLADRGIPADRMLTGMPLIRIRQKTVETTLAVDVKPVAAALETALRADAGSGDELRIPHAVSDVVADWRPNATLVLGADGGARLEPVRFSAFACLRPDRDPAVRRALLTTLGRGLRGLDRPLAVYGWDPAFLEDLVDACPELLDAITAAAMHRRDRPASWRGRPVLGPEDLGPGHGAVFLAETRMDRRFEMRRRLADGVEALCPDILAEIAADMLPPDVWVPDRPSIYPVKTPGLEVRDGLDVLVLDLPGRNVPATPLGIGYVRNALAREGVAYQIVDADIVTYHRFHARRLFDRVEGGGPAGGAPPSEDPWDLEHGAMTFWTAPSAAGFLLDLFADDLDEIVGEVVRAAPKVLAFSVHAQNDWASAEVARRVRAALPDIVVLAGGYSCYYPESARACEVRADYYCIGEADMTVGPLVRALANGERPFDLPGVISTRDTPGRRFLPAPFPDETATNAPPVYDWVDDIDVYRTHGGNHCNRIVAGRGCVWAHCTFCAERFSWRGRDVKAVVDEIERYCAGGRPVMTFNESDVGGNRTILLEIAKEIIRRGLRPSLSGLIRAHAGADAAFFQTLADAGFRSLCFGIDAWSRHTLKLQRKGYSTATIINNLRDAAAAGIAVYVNIVIGTPKETEEDIDESIELLLRCKDHIDGVANINVLSLALGSVYWEEPEKHDIVFHGDRETLYREHPRGLPPDLWHSENPHIDADVRHKRFLRIVEALRSGGVAFFAVARDAVAQATADAPRVETARPAARPVVLRFARDGERPVRYRADRNALEALITVAAE